VIPWNFTKFLVDRKGKVVRFFKPNDDIEEVHSAVKMLLK
jgi:glutathione peroxidase-family protein